MKGGDLLETPITRTYTLPAYKDWYLCFEGHPEELADVEDKLAISLAVLNPVVFDDGTEKLNIYLEWNKQIAFELLEILGPYANRLTINERRRESCQDTTT